MSKLMSVERYLAMKHTHAYNTELVKGALLLTCSALKRDGLTGVYFFYFFIYLFVCLFIYLFIFVYFQQE